MLNGIFVAGFLKSFTQQNFLFSKDPKSLNFFLYDFDWLWFFWYFGYALLVSVIYDKWIADLLQHIPLQTL